MFKKLFLSGLCLAISSSSLLAMENEVIDEKKHGLVVSFEDKNDLIPVAQNAKVRGKVTYGNCAVVYSLEDGEKGNEYTFNFALDDKTSKFGKNLHFSLNVQKDPNVEMTPNSETNHEIYICDVDTFNEEKILKLLKISTKPLDLNKVVEIYPVENQIDYTIETEYNYRAMQLTPPTTIYSA